MRADPRGFMIPLALMSLPILFSLRISAHPNSAEPLDKAQVLGLVRGGVADRRLATLVKERGIDFSPTPRYIAELRRAGAGEGAVEALRLAAPRREQITEPRPQVVPNENTVVNQAHVLSQEGKWAQAAAVYRTALESEPNDPAALNDLGVALAKSGDLNDAIDSYRKAAALSPRVAAVHDNLGVALQKKGDAPGAVREFRAAVEVEPSDAQAHENLGLALENQGDLGGAVREYRTVLQLDGGSHEAQYNLGRALEKTGDTDGAIAAFQRAVAQQPDNALTHYGLGTALEARGDFSAALDQYRQAQRLAPQNLEIATAYVKLKRTAEVERAGFRSN